MLHDLYTLLVILAFFVTAQWIINYLRLLNRTTQNRDLNSYTNEYLQVSQQDIDRLKLKIKEFKSSVLDFEYNGRDFFLTAKELNILALRKFDLIKKLDSEPPSICRYEINDNTNTLLIETIYNIKNSLWIPFLARYYKSLSERIEITFQQEDFGFRVINSSASLGKIPLPDFMVKSTSDSLFDYTLRLIFEVDIESSEGVAKINRVRDALPPEFQHLAPSYAIYVKDDPEFEELVSKIKNITIHNGALLFTF